MSNEELHKTPVFGKKLGFLYPLAHKILGTHEFWSPSRWIPHSALATDLYILSCWIIEIIIIYFISSFDNSKILSACLFIAMFRYLDLMFVLLSILVKGFYKNKDWASSHRVTFLVVCNAIEIMVLFAIFYFGFGKLLPGIGSTEPPIDSFFQALYFSVNTGTCIGFGIPSPQGWITKLLTMFEGSSIVLVVIAVIGYISNEKSKENKKHE
jgi:hypothetical protein